MLQITENDKQQIKEVICVEVERKQKEIIEGSAPGRSPEDISLHDVSKNIDILYDLIKGNGEKLKTKMHDDFLAAINNAITINAQIKEVKKVLEDIKIKITESNYEEMVEYQQKITYLNKDIYKLKHQNLIFNISLPLAHPEEYDMGIPFRAYTSLKNILTQYDENNVLLSRWSKEDDDQ